jgi:hypothetical protein
LALGTLGLGTTRVGSNNLGSSGATTATSAKFGELPANGVTVYALPYTALNGSLVHTGYTLTSAE